MEGCVEGEREREGKIDESNGLKEAFNTQEKEKKKSNDEQDPQA